MVKHGHGLAFIFKAAAHIVVDHIFFTQDFDRDNTILNHIVGLIDIGHSADADQLGDLITTVELFAHVFIHSNILLLTSRQ